MPRSVQDEKHYLILQYVTQSTLFFYFSGREKLFVKCLPCRILPFDLMARILLLEEEAIKKAADPASSTSTTASNQPQRNMTSNSSCSVRLFALGKIFPLLNSHSVEIYGFFYFSDFM